MDPQHERVLVRPFWGAFLAWETTLKYHAKFSVDAGETLINIPSIAQTEVNLRPIKDCPQNLIRRVKII